MSDIPGWPKGTVVFARGGKDRGETTGTMRRCPLEGCIGIRLGVRWKDGKMTWPCTKGMQSNHDGTFRVVG